MFMKTVYILLTCLSTVLGENECKQIDACRCRLKNGQEINLHRFENDGYPKFQVNTKTGQVTYSPCRWIDCGKGVTNSSICLKDDKGNLQSLGNLTNARFDYNKSASLWTLKYKSKGEKTNSTVLLKCNNTAAFFLDPKSNSTNYVFHLSSPCVCPDGCLSVARTISTGTILLLIFFSLLLVYFGVGSLYRKSVYGAEGREIIPNVSFWFSLPGLIRDGYLFFISPCLGERVEYRYYDRL